MRAERFMIMHDVMTKKKVERCLPPCHALTVVVGESTEHFLELRLRYDRFGNRNIVFTHALIQNDEQRGR